MMIIYIVLLCTCTQNTVSAQKIKFEGISKDIYENIFIYYLKGPTIYDTIKINLEDGLSLTDLPFFNVNLMTHFHFPGWGEHINATSIHALTKAFLMKNIRNVAVVDYSSLAHQVGNSIRLLTSYEGSLMNVSYIGTAIGQFLKAYIPAKQPMDLIHLMGHSLGGQIIGASARYFGSGKLWLSAMDPAGPGFKSEKNHLSASDGCFVDVIHTDGLKYGDDRLVGTVDFYPNRGISNQPGCTSDIFTFCSHQRSWRYYAESIVKPENFLGKQCNKTFFCDVALILCSCNDFDVAIMGFHVNKTARGSYYLQTNSVSPYGLGKKGLSF